MDKQANTTGQCYCGNVKYHFTGDILKKGLCYCRDCQRLTGGLALPFLVVLSETLHIQGAVKEFTRMGSSGHPVHMAFCEQCGSRLFGRFGAWPQVRSISASSLDDISQFSPEVQIWTEEAPHWAPFLQDIPKVERSA